MMNAHFPRTKFAQTDLLMAEYLRVDDVAGNAARTFLLPWSFDVAVRRAAMTRAVSGSVTFPPIIHQG